MAKHKKKTAGRGTVEPRGQKDSVLFERKEVQQRIKQSLRRSKLASLTRFVHEPKWREALAQELPDGNPDKIIAKLKRDHQKLVNEFRKEAKRTTGKPSLGPVGRFGHIGSGSQYFGAGSMPDWFRRSIECMISYPSTCTESGLLGLTERFSDLDFSRVVSGSYANGQIYPWVAYPGWLEFTAQLFDSTEWWRYDSWDTFGVYSEIYFDTPPAPCDGTLSWEVAVSGLLRSYLNSTNSDGTVSLDVLNFVAEDVEADAAPGEVRVPISGDLLYHQGETIYGNWSDPMPFSGSFSVTEGQVSRIYFLCLAYLTAFGGMVDAQGGFAFYDPSVSNRETPTGLRYAFIPG